MLHEFLSGNRDAILALSKRKAGAIAGSKTVLKDLERGLPDFYDRLMAVAGMQLKPQGWIDSKRGELFLRLHFPRDMRVCAHRPGRGRGSAGTREGRPHAGLGAVPFEP